MENPAIEVPERGDLVAPFFYYFVNETVTETGVLCLICIFHKMTPVTETALLRGRRGDMLCLRCFAAQVLDRDSQQSCETY